MYNIVCLFHFQDSKELQLEPDVTKLRHVKRSVLGRRVINKVKRPDKRVSTIGRYTL